jgi:UDP-3-O-[3-hydroxymyristoyl] glucosamine N-acyltransferase
MYKLGELARIIKAELIGNPEAMIKRARPFETAEEGDVSLAATPAFRALISGSRASALIVAPPAERESHNLLVSTRPKLAFARAIAALHGKPYHSTGVSADLIAGEGAVLGRDLSIHPRVTIGHHSSIGDRVVLHPGVVIGDRCRIGNDTVLHANVSIYDDCEVGNRVIIHGGTIVGADGFGFVPDEEGRQVKLLHLGRVKIEDDCEIGANCAIDRGGFGETILRRGVKLDNLIQVGHNVDLGENTVVVALTGFSGGTKVGCHCVIAGQVGTVEHVVIGDGATICARAAVTKRVRPGAVIAGLTPAQDYKSWRRSQVLYSKLPEIIERLKRLEKIVGQGAGSDQDSLD